MLRLNNLSGPVPSVTLHLQFSVLWTYSGCMSVKSMRSQSVPFVILGFRRVLVSTPFADNMRPQCTILPSLHCCKLYSRLLPNQNGVTSGQCGLVGRPRVLRVPFGTGPQCPSHRQTIGYRAPASVNVVANNSTPFSSLMF